MFKNKMSLRLRIFISMILLVFTATLLVLGSTYYQYRTESDQYNSYRQERKENQLKRQINYIVNKYDISEIIFSGIPPVRKLTQVPHPLLHVLSLKAYIFEKALRDFCKKNEECCFIDIDLPVSSQTMAIDGFHPNEVFYSAWAKRISKSIIK